MKRLLLFSSVILLMGYTCMGQVNLKVEQYKLKNGLDVILQQDNSDPIVAVAIQYHVGSGREKIGKTGFAHFFEHMLFQRSENLPRNAFFKNISDIGGTFNGSTNTDGTNYYEIVPGDALERVLWMESDRMGYFINTVTQGGLEREIDVVSNEKRQNYDTRPYGQLQPIIAKYGYPSGHPYSWTTIGEIADLRTATIADVKEFYHTYYMPNNATLVISGDFDVAQAKTLIEKYFGEIPAGKQIIPIKPVPAPVTQTKRYFYEDNYANMPMMVLSFSAPEQYHADSYALSLLASVMSQGKQSPLYKVLVEEKKIASSARLSYSSRELAGSLMLTVNAYANVNLNDVYAAVEEAFARFEKDGFTEDMLKGIKAVREVNIYNMYASVQGRALAMARDNTFGGNPMRTLNDTKKYNTVTKQEIINVYNKYLKGQKALEISMVPKGKVDFALHNSERAVVSVEKVEDQLMKSEQTGTLVDQDYPRTPSKIDRSKEPAMLSNAPSTKMPLIWSKTGTNGMKISTIANNELPIVRFALTVKGGMMYDPAGKDGVALVYTSVLMNGTKNKSAEELAEEFNRLGANVNCSLNGEEITISGNCLSRDLAAVVDLVAEVLTEPRFDKSDFDLAKQRAISGLAQQTINPQAIAGTTARRLLYAPENRLSRSGSGDKASLEAITIEDIKSYHDAYMAPNIATMNFVGNVTLTAASNATKKLSKVWKKKSVAPAPKAEGVVDGSQGKLYFIDTPGAQQSYIMIVCGAMSFSSLDYYPAYVANYRLGTGSQGELFNELRLKRGYTYGAYSAFNTDGSDNRFVLSSSVQATKTKESLEIIQSMLNGYADNYSQEFLDRTRTSIVRGNAGAFETPNALMSVLSNISSYGLPDDYVMQRENVVKNITLDHVKDIVRKYIDPHKMTYIVVGDAKTQADRLKDLGLGAPIMVSREGKVL